MSIRVLNLQTLLIFIREVIFSNDENTIVIERWLCSITEEIMSSEKLDKRNSFKSLSDSSNADTYYLAKVPVLLILRWSCNIPYRRASAVGGHPGT